MKRAIAILLLLAAPARADVTTVFADSTDGSINSGNSTTTWANARNGTGSLDLNAFGTSVITWGAFNGAGGDDFAFHQPFWKFDTSGIDDAHTISAAIFCADLQSSYDATTDLYQIRLTTDWSTLATADYVNGTAFAALTLLSEVDYDDVQASGYTEFTITSPNTNVTKTGTVFVVGGTKHFADNTTPPTADGGWDWNPTETASDTSDPKLVVVHAAGGGGAPVKKINYYNRMIRGQH